MYGKLFSSMYDGTLYGQWQAIITLQQMVILADEDGVVDITPPALAAKTSIPMEIIEKGLEQLSEPDKYSRSGREEGRRIIPLDPDRPWGWQIVNYRYYRDMATREEKKRKDRERISEKRSKNNDVASCRVKSQSVADVAHTDVYTDTDTDEPKDRSSANAPDRFAEFWETYPKKVKKAEARKKWKLKKLDAKADEIIADVKKRLTKDRRWLDGYTPDPTTYINGERWDDEMETGRSDTTEAKPPSQRRLN